MQGKLQFFLLHFAQTKHAVFVHYYKMHLFGIFLIKPIDKCTTMEYNIIAEAKTSRKASSPAGSLSSVNNKWAASLLPTI